MQRRADREPVVAVFHPVFGQFGKDALDLAVLKLHRRTDDDRHQVVVILVVRVAMGHFVDAPCGHGGAGHDGSDPETDKAQVQRPFPEIGLLGDGVDRRRDHGLRAGSHHVDFPVEFLDLAVLRFLEDHREAAGFQQLLLAERLVGQEVEVPRFATAAADDTGQALGFGQQAQQRGPCLTGQIRVADVEIDDVQIKVADPRRLAQADADVGIRPIGLAQHRFGLPRQFRPVARNGALFKGNEPVQRCTG